MEENLVSFPRNNYETAYEMLYKLINVTMLPISQKSCYMYISHSFKSFQQFA